MKNNNKQNRKGITVWLETIAKKQAPFILNDKTQNDISTSAQKTQLENSAAYKKKLDENIVEGLIKRSDRILVSIKSHGLPFDFFPDIINVEDARITIIIRHSFSSEIHSVDIKDISNVFINNSFLFSQLVIVSNTFEDNQIEILNLRKKEAAYVRRIIEGLRVFIGKGIDTSNYTKDELVAKLEELSTTQL